MNFKPLLIALAALGAAALLALAAGIGGLAAAVLIGVVVGYLMLRRTPGASHEKFFGEAGDETELTETRMPPPEGPRR